MTQTAFRLFLSLLVYLIPLSAGEEFLRLKMISDLEVIKNTYDVYYAPANWKKEFSGWDLDEAYEKAKDEIMHFNNVSIKDYQKLVRRFLLSMKDYHVAPIFHSTEIANLPFKMQSAERRYFVTSTNPRSVVYAQFPLSVGDEILSFNGIPIDEAVQSFKREEFGNPDSPTDQGMAEGFFTSRLGSLGHVVPRGKAAVEVRPRGRSDVIVYSGEWDYHPEQFQSPFNRTPKRGEMDLDENRPLCEHPFFAKKMTTPYASAIKAMNDLLGIQGRDLLGCTLDAEGGGNRIVYQTGSSFFQAYIYETPKKQKIGYVRLPTYQAGYNEVQELARILSYFQSNTQALVLDQLNNPGGYFFFMYAVASLLTDRPLKVPLHRQTLTQEEVSFALRYLSLLENVRNTYDAQRVIGYTIQGYPIDFKGAQAIKQHFNNLIEEWNTGNILTTPLPLYGFASIEPHPTARYSKPILMLINHMDFSCGDFLPAILQDNHRAILLGTRTAGAGGFVLKGSHPNRFGLASYSFTGSIAERLDSRPIENLGVTPDIPYEMTARDLEENYCDYHASIQAALDLLLAK